MDAPTGGIRKRGAGMNDPYVKTDVRFGEYLLDRDRSWRDLPTRAVSSADFSNLRPAIRDAVDGSIAKIVQIQNNEAPPAAERYEHCERQAWEACMEWGGACCKRVWKTGMRDRTELPTSA